MKPFLTIRDEEVPLKITLRRQARRLVLRVDPRARIVRVTVPNQRMMAQVERFVDEHHTWICQKLPPLPAALQDNYQFPILGRTITLHLTDKAPRIALNDDQLYCSSPVPHLTIPRFLKSQFLEYLQTHIPPLAHKIGKKVTQIRLREANTRWGSCAPDGNLMFHWRLVFASPEVVQYLMAHEVAHLTHPNHSSAFWQLVEDLMPDYALARYWLKKHGPSLYTYFP